MDLVIATVSGYKGSERFKLIKLISKAGANYVGEMNSSITHLVCYKFEGKKYELAKKFKTVVVNHRWVEECVKEGRRVDEKPYMKQCGFEVGPLSANGGKEVRSVLGEVRIDRNVLKKPVIVIDDDDGDDEWADDSLLLKENLFPAKKQNKDRPSRLRRKGSKRSSRQDVLLTNKYCSEESTSFGSRRIESEDLSTPSHHINQKGKSTTIYEPSKRSCPLIHKSIRDELGSLSDLDEDFQHKDIHISGSDMCAPSNYSGKPESSSRKTRLQNRGKRRTSILEEIEDLNATSNHSAGVDDECNKTEHKRSSRQDVLLRNEYCLESEDLSTHSHHVNQKGKNTSIYESSKRSCPLIHKSIRDELGSLSDLDEDFLNRDIHISGSDMCEPSNYSGKPESSSRITRLQNCGKRRTLILEETEDMNATSNHSAGVDDDYNKTEHNLKLSKEVDDDCNKTEHNPKSSKDVLLSCVICWTDFSSTRGVLPCGHRFCFSCIQNWADHMASMSKVSTCPLCKASFYSIQKMEDAVSSDQKIYSQTIPNDCPITDVYILPHGESSAYHTLPPPIPVCYQCSCREPEELLITCHSCQVRCVHSYCLDPPQVPWVCVHCKDLRMRYAR